MKGRRAGPGSPRALCSVSRLLAVLTGGGRIPLSLSFECDFRGSEEAEAMERDVMNTRERCQE